AAHPSAWSSAPSLPDALPISPLRPGQPGNAFKDYVEARRGKGGAGSELLVTKSVNSAFHGSPDLDAWLKDAGITQFAVAGIQTKDRKSTRLNSSHVKTSYAVC